MDIGFSKKLPPMLLLVRMRTNNVGHLPANEQAYTIARLRTRRDPARVSFLYDAELSVLRQSEEVVPKGFVNVIAELVIRELGGRKS